MHFVSLTGRRAALQTPSGGRGKRRPPNPVEVQRRKAFGIEWGAFMHRASEQLHRELTK